MDRRFESFTYVQYTQFKRGRHELDKLRFQFSQSSHSYPLLRMYRR